MHLLVVVSLDFYCSPRTRPYLCGVDLLSNTGNWFVAYRTLREIMSLIAFGVGITESESANEGSSDKQSKAADEDQFVDDNLEHRWGQRRDEIELVTNDRADPHHRSQSDQDVAYT